MTNSTQPFKSYEQPPADERAEMLRRIYVVGVATDSEHAAELAVFPDLFSNDTAQPSSIPTRVTYEGEAIGASMAINSAAYSERQTTTAQEQHLADIRQQIKDEFAA